MSELPEGWVPVTIKELAGASGIFVDGDWVESKDQDPNGDIRLLQLADIGDGAFLDKSDRWINEDAFARLRCTELAADGRRQLSWPPGDNYLGRFEAGMF